MVCTAFYMAGIIVYAHWANIWMKSIYSNQKVKKKKMRKKTCSGRRSRKGRLWLFFSFMHLLMCFVVCFVCFSSFSNCCKANKSCPRIKAIRDQSNYSRLSVFLPETGLSCISASCLPAYSHDLGDEGGCSALRAVRRVNRNES